MLLRTDNFASNGDTKLVPRDARNFILYIPSEIALKIQHFVKAVEAKECQWFHCVKREEDPKNHTVIYSVDKFFIPEQEVTAGTAEADPKQMGKLAAELSAMYPDFDELNEVLSTMTVWAHSHVNMPVSPSGTDEQNYKELIQFLEASECKTPVIMLIFNKKNEVYARIWDPEIGFFIEHPRLIVGMDFTLDLSYIDNAVKDKIKTKTYATHTSTTYQQQHKHYAGQGNTTSYSTGREFGKPLDVPEVLKASKSYDRFSKSKTPNKERILGLESTMRNLLRKIFYNGKDLTESNVSAAKLLSIELSEDQQVTLAFFLKVFRTQNWIQNNNWISRAGLQEICKDVLKEHEEDAIVYDEADFVTTLLDDNAWTYSWAQFFIVFYNAVSTEGNLEEDIELFVNDYINLLNTFSFFELASAS